MEYLSQLDDLLPAQDTTIAKDLRLNLKRILGEGALSPEEGQMALLALARSAEHEDLQNFAAQALKTLGVSEEHINEARESAALMGMLNTYYKFRSMVADESHYKTAGLRMTALAKPALGKERFETLAFAVSVFNACPTCVRSHEQVLVDAGFSRDKIHDLARMAAVVKGLVHL